jgi:hypothetical protein
MFKVMMDIVTSVRPESIETLVQSLRSLSLQHESFAGEDLDRVNQLIRGTISRLAMVYAVPFDIYRVICVIYQTSTTPEFNAKFQLLANLHELGQATTVPTFQTLLAKGEEEYRTLHSCNAWCAASKRKTPKQSAFLADGTANDSCHRCGKPGHFAKDCKAAAPANKAATNATKAVGPLRTPPKDSEPHKKTFPNQDGTTSERLWCEKCNLWNKTHPTKDHRSKAAIAAETTGAANVAAVSPPTPVATPVEDQPVEDAKVEDPELPTIWAAAHSAQDMMAGLLQPSSRG